ncbi:cytochrome o ubiquinol oxidase subunit IV [Sphingomonas sp. CFBP 13733]|jgi:cytochrome o ubiquinol oxidase operon protein cyoD|uniref:cytochrome o ubiquinol oxidase subunit IV n=1 Tax=Sphingomonas sp. CFBP 13733 TaxID=2775291 RepID=UPI001780EAFF|nr:cytochrome C oxidase subunit IV family protein [Sphingomonas sp. CFBP 13733]MBD8641583.1 cytochrome C oxidase subunit IV family protein [Sphingomonas sp. CFBP 13733]
MSAPQTDQRREKRREILTYAIGYALALALTGSAFAAVHWPSFPANTTLGLVFGLALVQMIVHLRCFLHVSVRRSSRDDLFLILFSTLIIILMVAGTIVIIANLHGRMM